MATAIVKLPRLRPQQAEAVKLLNRFNVLVCHRRWGKTVFCIIQLILACTKPNARVAYVSPLYRQSKAVAWDYARNFTKQFPEIKHNESELRVDFPNGARLQLFGADSPDSLRGQGFDLVVLDEYAQMTPRAWAEVIRPALADKQGKAIFIGTPMGHNNFYQLYQMAQKTVNDDWTAIMHKASESGVLPKAELDAARRIMSDAEYEQEFECSWSAAIRGAYWAKEMEQATITRCLYDENYPVTTSWDLGIKDSTVIWFMQEIGSEVRVIDCMAFQGTGLPLIIKQMKEKPYYYSRHIAPHDIEVRELGSGKSRYEVASQLGVGFEIAPRLSVQDGIQAVRSLLKRCVFHEDLEIPIEALKQYRSEFDDKKGVFRLQPLHDWCSDYADAFRYYAVSPQDAWKGELDYTNLYKAII